MNTQKDLFEMNTGKIELKVKQASMNDAEGIMALHHRYHINSISEKDKPSGFITTNFKPDQLERLISQEKGVTIATLANQIVCYAMAASWAFWSEWPFYAHMIQRLPENKFMGIPLSTDTSYQYGPVCVDTSVRGTGAFEKVFVASLKSMSAQYPVMVTFINQINHRSLEAHTRKVHMSVVGEFQYNSNDYHMLACATK